ncbi:MAG: glycine--tRNA ligase subunit alpha, partial [Deltaproteobacteria bacterium]
MNEIEQSGYNFDESDKAMLFKLFDMYEAESKRLAGKGLSLPAYDYCLKCSHTFNLLDARGAISVAERTSFIGRVRALARSTAQIFLKTREDMGFRLLNRDAQNASQEGGGRV